MSKSLTGIINNRKSVSGLNSMNVYDVSVEGVLKTPNIDNVETTIQNIETQQNTNTANISVNSSNISSNTLGISENSTNFINLNTRMNDAETDITNLTTNVNNNTSAITTNQSDINELQILTGDMYVNAGDFLIDVGNGNSIEFQVNTSNQLLIDNTGVIVGNDITCNTDSSYSMGSSSFRFNNGYFNNLDLLQTLTTRYYTDDTSIDLGNIASSTSCDRFRKQIIFDTGLRTMYIGQLYQSTNTSNSLFAIGLDGGGGYDPNIGFVMNNGGDCQTRGNFRSNNIYPGVDDTYDLGSSSLRWDDVYATNGTIQTCDERQKYYIQSLEQDKMVEFIRNINPVRYKWKSEKEKQGNRFHCGFIAQHFKKQMPFDFGGLIYDTEADIYGLRYNELIAPLVSVIQQLIKRIEALENPKGT